MGDINNRGKGSHYEELAADYLCKKGYKILERNYHNHRFGEIDIIARDGDVIVAVEVKYRKNAAHGNPFEAVGATKQRRISRALLSYLMTHHKGMDTPCRFDVIGILGDSISHIENAFYYRE